MVERSIKNAFMYGFRLCLLVFSMFITACTEDDEHAPVTLTLVGTTTTEYSGFLDYMIGHIETEYKVKIRKMVFTTKRALRVAQDGNADLLLVHDPHAEEAFIMSGYGDLRDPIMENNFILIGPEESELTGLSLTQAFKVIAERQLTFISRADQSGTHMAELFLWKRAGYVSGTFDREWYVKSGAPTGQALHIAKEKSAYMLVDQASWITFNNKKSMEKVSTEDDDLPNIYHLISIFPKPYNNQKKEIIYNIHQWFKTAEAKSIIDEYRYKGQQLYQSVP